MFCREELVAQGRSNVDAVRHELEREQKVNDIKAVHLKAACWDIMAVPEAKILPVGQCSLASGLADYEATDEMSTHFAAGNLVPVSNMPIRKLSEAEAQRLLEVFTSPTDTVQRVPLYIVYSIYMAVCNACHFTYVYMCVYISVCVYYIVYYIYGCVMHTQHGFAQYSRGVCPFISLEKRGSAAFCLTTTGAVLKAGGV